MGEEKKEEVVEKKKEEEKKEEAMEIVLKVDMHCEACARKVARSLKGFQGVEEVKADCKGQKVVVKGKGADPIKVCQRIEKKSGRKAELLSPLPLPLPNNQQNDDKQNKEAQVQQPKQEENKQEPPAAITLVLKVGMHCEACALALKKKIRKIQGVESVVTDIANDQVTVKGVVDPDKLVSDVYKRTGKQASIVVKEEEKKEDDEKDGEAKDQKQEEKKDAEESKEDEDKKTSSSSDIKKVEYCPSSKDYYMNMEHAYAPQFFSDENPNACSVM